jgi:hypothetical protein
MSKWRTKTFTSYESAVAFIRSNGGGTLSGPFPNKSGGVTYIVEYKA